jgi:hydroxymethylpyrimidine/phosphomethylpyrimidine kinase
MIKIGALGSAANVQAIADRISSLDVPVVVDPVMISKHGHSLIDDEAVELYRSKLLRHAYLVTPNRFEAEKLTGISLDSQDNVAKAIHDMHQMGARYVLLKLGDEDGKSMHVFGDGNANVGHVVQRLKTHNTHGTGCALSAAITARLSRGEKIQDSVNRSIEDVWQAIHAGQPLGKGHHPIEFRLIGAT